MSKTMMNIEDMKKQLQKDLKPARYAHTLGVMETAQELAERFGCDPEKAKIAGLLHDCAKGFSDEKKLKICSDRGIMITQAEQANPSLLHARCGAIRAREKYHVEDEEILHAILVHTTGCPGMNLLDKIVYIADYIEPNRNQAPDLPVVRKLAREDLDRTICQISEDTICYLEETGAAIDETTVKVYNYYKKLCKGEQH